MMPAWTRSMAAAALAWLLAGCAGGPGPAPTDLRLVPYPKSVQPATGFLELQAPLRFEAPAAQAEVLGGLVAREFERAGLPRPELAALAGPGLACRLLPAGSPAGAALPLPQADSDEVYSLRIGPEGAVVAGRSPAGLVHGVQTLVQLIRANRQGTKLPAVSIGDWPSLRWRCFQNDMTRGPSATLATLEEQAELGSLFKMNLLTYYMEHQFAFAKHAIVAPKDGSLTPEELGQVVAHARPLGLEVVGSQQSFGHLAGILGHEPYAALRESKNVLTPVKEESYQLLDDLYAEVCPLTPFPFFNVNCDETWDLGQGPSKELATKIGVGGVYVQHLRRIHDLLAEKYHKRMMMWGDIILKHPEQLDKIPRDTIMLSWGYEARPSFEDKIIPFEKSGYEFFVCPGLSDWNRILPDFQRAEVNIRNYVRDGFRHGAIGMLNTEWKDNGENLNACNWHGYAWGAECAWNGSSTDPADFNRRLGGVLFGERGNHFELAMRSLSQLPRLPWMEDYYGSGILHVRLFWDGERPLKKTPADLREQAGQLLGLVGPALEHLQACRAEATANAGQLEALIFGARRVEQVARRWQDTARMAELYDAATRLPADQAIPRLAQAGALARQQARAHADLKGQYEKLYLAENRPYALDWTTKRYDEKVAQFETLAQKLDELAAALKTGTPLPPPESLGLAIPKPEPKSGV